ncbi:MAG: helix-turn-helix domain-containing protein [Puniceicoccales bacterium]|jgi:transcriptional regulator with XRE-family HTH domain|nr:helix-turn-helix domain-containing protein [Puniceicoccales bacterium]
MAGENFGTRLKNAREALNMSLKDVEDLIKIRADFLAAIEEGTFFKVSIPEVYRQGFIRSYAEFLHIDSREILLQLGDSEGSPRSRKAPQVSQEQTQLPPVITAGELGDQNQAGCDGLAASKAFLVGVSQAVIQRLRERNWQIGLGCATAALLACALFWKLPRRHRPNALEDLLDRSTAEMIALDEISAKRLTLTASDVVKVFMRNKVTKEKLFSGSLKKGESKHIDYYDDVQISFSEGGALTILKENGETVRPKKAGAGWLEMRYQD